VLRNEAHHLCYSLMRLLSSAHPIGYFIFCELPSTALRLDFPHEAFLFDCFRYCMYAAVCYRETALRLTDLRLTDLFILISPSLYHIISTCTIRLAILRSVMNVMMRLFKPVISASIHRYEKLKSNHIGRRVVASLRSINV
jgi:hypothetical protein